MKLFVWDFHGVLEKDNEKAVIDISNQVLKRAGYKERFTDKDNERLYGVKWYQYFEDLLPGLSNEGHLSLQAACFKFAEDNLHILRGTLSQMITLSRCWVVSLRPATNKLSSLIPGSRT